MAHAVLSGQAAIVVNASDPNELAIWTVHDAKFSNTAIGAGRSNAEHHAESSPSTAHSESIQYGHLQGPPDLFFRAHGLGDPAPVTYSLVDIRVAPASVQ